MPRARLSAAGIDIAKPGYDVDTAGIENMQFSSSLVAMRVVLTGTVTVTDFTGFMDNYYKRAEVIFPTPFVRPPPVMVAGLYDDGTTDQTPVALSIVTESSGRVSRVPVYEVRVTTTGFELFASDYSNFLPRPTDWRYFVFQNTLDT